MNQPEGYDDGTSWLCHLIKTLCGLKQSGRDWNEEVDSKLGEIKFNHLYTDPCVYIWCNGNSIEIIMVWVDDLLLFTNSKDKMVKLKDNLKGLFDITNLGKSNKLMGLEFTRDRERGTLTIRQTQYIESILQKYDMHGANSVSTPLDSKVKLEPQEPNAQPQSLYGNYASS